MSFGAPKTKTPCACCGKPAIWTIWSIDVCNDCSAEWHADSRFSSGTINAALGFSDDPRDYRPAAHEAYCREAEKRTRAWVSEKRTKARAA